MLKYLQIAVLALLTSFYFFPLEFTVLPGVNTKMAMAGFGLVMVGLQLSRKRNQSLDRGMVTISLFALLVSVTSFISVVLNETHDYSYVSFIVSMWVWLSGAYVVVSLMKLAHGKISVEMVCNYLILVCVLQCFSALLIDWIPAFRLWVANHISALGPTPIMKLIASEEERLFGLGAALDHGGSRFAAVLVLLAYVGAHIHRTGQHVRVITYVLAFLVITVVGNMIARTTIVGVAVAGLYLIYATGLHRLVIRKSAGQMVAWFIGVLVVAIPVMTWMYYNNEAFREDLRFAFEGFFSLAERGEWGVSSNERLKSMVVFPDNLKTWIIGDGYFVGTAHDPYYTGKIYSGYYMDTDIGYLRFIFYSGLIGLGAMVLFMWKAAQICAERLSNHGILFWMILVVNYIVWLKVSTDLFLLLALFLVIMPSDLSDEDKLLQEEES
ncbi:MAG: hypothetical protein Q4A18_02060 [Rikenellaceae bacterium]|nr:hypothetical protein [Rikenellaceae bacterium]